MGDVWESDGVVVETWESSTEPGVTFTTVIREGDIVTGGSGVDLSDAAPQDLGTAAAGTSEDASRADHVHDMPNAADVGADPTGTAAALVDDLSGVSNASTARSNLGLGTAAVADTGTGSSNVVLGNDARLSDARTPSSTLAHKSTHATGGSDALTASDIGAQPVDSDLTAIAALTTTPFGRSLLALADAAALRTAAGTVIGTDVQAYDAELAAIAGLTSAADRVPYFTGSGTASTTTLTTFGRSLIDDADAATARTTLGAHPLGDLNPVWPNTTDHVNTATGLSAQVTATTVVSAIGITFITAATVSAIKISVATGQASSTVGLAIYSSTSGGRPGSLLYDAGTVATDTNGIKTKTLAANQALPAGLYFIAATCANNPGTAPTLYGNIGGTSGGSAARRGAISDNNTRNGNYYFTTTGGAFTSSPTWTLGLYSGVVCPTFGLTIASVP